MSEVLAMLCVRFEVLYILAFGRRSRISRLKLIPAKTVQGEREEKPSLWHGNIDCFLRTIQVTPSKLQRLSDLGDKPLVVTIDFVQGVQGLQLVSVVVWNLPWNVCLT